MNFFAYLYRMRYIERWSLMRSTVKENVSEHSHSVAILAHALGVVNNRIFSGKVDPDRLAVYALFHETSEVLTGDLPTPIKYYNPEIKSAYKAIEAVACEKMLGMLPAELRPVYEPIVREELDEYEARLLKAADKLDALIKCIDEGKSGNREFSKAERSIRAELSGYGLDEVDYFMEQLLPAFSLTLDEME